SNDGSHRSTGLGLSLVKKLTEMQGGKFIVHSQIGKGTNMILEFARKEV
ncbi:MAG: HAMP domain-containing histidine kinase, partial [Caulobacterales bacterium]|nr:HAMP domain-containing histidine kinase [Caulobacterales bacterium]